MSDCTIIKRAYSDYWTRKQKRWAARCPQCGLTINLAYNKNSRKAAKDALYYHVKTMH